ncbi:MAG TPA: hypothetical protein VL551_16790 [Actinospica sp.]|nr:hypothetical protein [Actinospica sp.]
MDSIALDSFRSRSAFDSSVSLNAVRGSSSRSADPSGRRVVGLITRTDTRSGVLAAQLRTPPTTERVTGTGAVARPGYGVTGAGHGLGST